MGPEVESFRYCCKYGKKVCKKWCDLPDNLNVEEKPVLVEDNVSKKKFLSEPDFNPDVDNARYCCRYGKKGCKKWCYTPVYAEVKPVLADDNADKSKFVSDSVFKPEVESFRYCCRYGRNNRCEDWCYEPTV